MKNFPKREKKKKSTKPYYCTFKGSIGGNMAHKKIPKYVTCPVCKRRLEPSIRTCTGGIEDTSWACCVFLLLNKHRAKK
jgi:hypothetical protein